MTTTIQDFFSPWDAPFWDAQVQSQTAEGPFPFPISIDGRGYVMNLKDWKHGTLEQYRNQSDTSREPGEQSLSIEGVWKRTGLSSVRGAGQEYYDDDQSDRTRFFRSRGIDPWTTRGVRLLPSTQRVRTSASANLRCLTFGDRFLFVDDDTIYSSDDPLNPDAAWVTEDVAPGAPVESIATDGTRVFLACGAGGVWAFTPGLTDAVNLVPGSALAATLVVYANGWLVATAGPVVDSVAADGTLSDPAVWTHRNPGFVWNAGASAPNAIYLAGNSGDQAEFYRTAPSQDGSMLAVPIFAGNLPPGELVHTMSYYQQVMLIGTSLGLRTATIDNAGGLSIGSVIEDPSGEGVRCFEARGQYAWFGFVNAFDANMRGLARADLAHDTEELVPAWAADLASSENDGRTVSVATWIEANVQRRLFCVAGSGLWAQRQELVEEGVLDLGWLAMGSPEVKTLQSVSVAHQSLRGSVELVVTNEKGGTVTAPWGEEATFASPEISRTLSGELLDLQIRLHRSTDDPTLGPVVRRWTSRVVPAPAAVDEIMVPILLGETVRDAGTGLDHWQYVYDEFRHLKDLENQRKVVIYREGQASYKVTIRSVAMEGAEDWSADRKFLSGVLMVRLVTVDGVPPQLPGGTFE